MTDLISGQIPFMVIDLAVAMGPIKEGKLKLYGVTSSTRIKAMPEVPTIAEAGVPGFAATGWFSVVARAGTPRPIIDKLNAALRAALASDDVKKRLAADGTDVTPSTPEEYVAFIDKDEIKWSKIVKASGAKGE
jgi:tripartite-type tricarboxylate transporter receptor subunit TctC